MILIHYYVSSNLLLQSAKSLLQVSSNNIEKEVNNFLKPAYQNINIATRLIENNIIIPAPSKQFTTFLLANIAEHPEYSAAYWGDPKGNFYIVERHPHNTFINETIAQNGKRSVNTQKIDLSGKELGKLKNEITKYDPRQRPWYTKAEKEQKMTISDVYLFYPWGENRPILGLTMAQPIYQPAKKLKGIFAIDIKLKSLSEFVTKLHVTKSAKIIIFDHVNRTLVAASELLNFTGRELPKLSTLKPAWALAAVQEYEKNKKQLFYYKYDKQKYLAFFDIISAGAGYEIFLAIALPISDITGELNEKLLYSVLITLLVLLTGMLLVGVASNSISQPIIKLANETKYIKQLDLSFISKVKSRIKEIIYLQGAFAVMMQSLKSFVSYVPLTIVKKLVETGDIAHVGGENKLATFLFSDITGFTSIAEQMQPSRLMAYLSEYLEVMTKIVLEKGGTVDKYIGDAIMAFWGAPTDDAKQAMHACQCALAMFACLEDLNRHWKNTGHPEIKMRIGISTGNAIIGNVGSKDRLNYTAIGDCVNVANRLEELNKVYATKIIISNTTYKIVKNNFSLRMLDHTTVRGKQEGIFIYELLPKKNQFGDKLQEYNDAFKTAFDFYQNGEWRQAIISFQTMSRLYPQDDLIQLYISRCQYLKDNQPKDWRGIWAM